MLRPCGACRALVAACAHWNPGYRPLVSRPLPPPSRVTKSLAPLWQSTVAREVLAEACTAPYVDVRGVRARREAAGRMARRGVLIQSAPRSVIYRATDEGRRVHARLLDMDAGRF